MGMCQSPSILKHYTSFINEREIWIVMPLMENGTLQQYIFNYFRKEEFLKEDLIVSILHQVLLGLDYLHNRKMIHNDLTSRSIVLDSDGSIKISALSSIIKLDGFKNVKDFVGTIHYMAPEKIEQIRGYN